MLVKFFTSSYSFGWPSGGALKGNLLGRILLKSKKYTYMRSSRMKWILFVNLVVLSTLVICALGRPDEAVAKDAVSSSSEESDESTSGEAGKDKKKEEVKKANDSSSPPPAGSQAPPQHPPQQPPPQFNFNTPFGTFTWGETKSSSQSASHTSSNNSTKSKETKWAAYENAPNQPPPPPSKPNTGVHQLAGPLTQLLGIA